MKRALVLLATLCSAMFISAVQAQEILPLEQIQSQADLDRTITALDTALFDSYNRCDLKKFASFFVDDVEFYHDQGGVTLGKKALAEMPSPKVLRKTSAARPLANSFRVPCRLSI